MGQSATAPFLSFRGASSRRPGPPKTRQEPRATLRHEHLGLSGDGRRRSVHNARNGPELGSSPEFWMPRRGHGRSSRPSVHEHHPVLITDNQFGRDLQLSGSDFFRGAGPVGPAPIAVASRPAHNTSPLSTRQQSVWGFDRSCRSLWQQADDSSSDQKTTGDERTEERAGWLPRSRRRTSRHLQARIPAGA